MILRRLMKRSGRTILLILMSGTLWFYDYVLRGGADTTGNLHKAQMVEHLCAKLYYVTVSKIKLHGIFLDYRVFHTLVKASGDYFNNKQSESIEKGYVTTVSGITLNTACPLLSLEIPVYVCITLVPISKMLEMFENFVHVYE